MKLDLTTRKNSSGDDDNLYGEGIARVSSVIAHICDDPDERLTDWAVSKGWKWREERQRFADIGTHTHRLIEVMLAGDMGLLRASPADAIFYLGAEFSKVPSGMRPQVANALGAFMAWAARFESIQVLSTEERIVNEQLRLGGTCDFKGILNGRRCMIDWKTSSGIRLKHKVQLAAYDLLHLHAYPDDPLFEQFAVVRFDRNGGGFEEKWWADLGVEREFFLHLLDVHQVQQQISLD